MPIGDAAAENILNKEFRGDDYADLASYWIGFKSGGVELTDGDSPGYARSEIVVEPASFGETSTKIIQNAVAFAIPPTGNATGNWLEADEVALFDAETAGNVRYSGPLDSPFQILNGRKRTFGVGALRIRFI